MEILMAILPLAAMLLLSLLLMRRPSVHPPDLRGRGYGPAGDREPRIPLVPAGSASAASPEPDGGDRP